MAYRGLREFLSVLRDANEIVDVNVPVDPVHELGSVLQTIERRGKAAYFHKVVGHSIGVVGSALGSHRRIALALDCQPTEIGRAIDRALSDPKPPLEIGIAPAQEETFEKVDLSRLPVPTHAPDDAGPYINAGVVIVRMPNSGRHNLSYVRFQVKGPEKVGISINLWRHMREAFEEAESRSENLPFCVAIGVDPSLMMAAAFRYEGDEYDIAGGLRGEPLPVARATLSDILVPAYAEVILEGEALAGAREPEGPMAEFTGHYSGVSPQPIGVIKAITHRHDPVFQTIAGASNEHLVLGNALTREPTLGKAVARVARDVIGVHLPPYASGFCAVVALDDPRPGEVHNVGIAALHAHMNIKVVIVVDKDVDIYDPAAVLWSLSTRVKWATDVNVIHQSGGIELDPSADEHGVVDKIIIDATLSPEQRGRYKKVNYPLADLAQLDL